MQATCEDHTKNKDRIEELAEPDYPKSASRHDQTMSAMSKRFADGCGNICRLTQQPVIAHDLSLGGGRADPLLRRPGGVIHLFIFNAGNIGAARSGNNPYSNWRWARADDNSVEMFTLQTSREDLRLISHDNLLASDLLFEKTINSLSPDF